MALAGFHMEEILDSCRCATRAFSTCFRRESGAAGKDTRGMFRVHQFNKVELFSFCDPAASGDEHERLLAIEEELVQSLGLPYRVVNVAAGDLGDPAAKKYDIEAWFPSQGRYREITSTSNTTDFQARRLGIRYRAEGGKLETPHTLNGTAVTDRWLLALLENFGGEVPEVLRALGAPAYRRRPQRSPTAPSRTICARERSRRWGVEALQHARPPAATVPRSGGRVRLNAAALKAAGRLRGPGVRIPPAPFCRSQVSQRCCWRGSSHFDTIVG